MAIAILERANRIQERCNLLKRLRREEAGAVLVETAFLAPMLTILFVLAAQWGLILFTYSSMETAARAAVREFAVGEADDETNGQLTNCGSIAGVSNGGGTSVEQIACDQIAGLFGVFSVAASDGTPGALGSHGADAQVTVTVSRDSIAVLDPFNLIAPTRTFAATAIMRLQNPGT